ncbi:hypothetical protein DFAR_3480010 [Desulfarculales bacterium]
MAAELIYEAEDYGHPSGQVRPDAQALGRRAMVVERQTPAGDIIYGQYDYLPAGKYLARFLRRLVALQRQGPVVHLDVARGGGRTLASCQVKSKGLKNGGYQEVEVAFTLYQADKNMEFRVAFLSSVAELYIDRIAVAAAPQGLRAYFKAADAPAPGWWEIRPSAPGRAACPPLGAHRIRFLNRRYRAASTLDFFFTLIPCPVSSPAVLDIWQGAGIVRLAMAKVGRVVKPLPPRLRRFVSALASVRRDMARRRGGHKKTAFLPCCLTLFAKKTACGNIPSLAENQDAELIRRLLGLGFGLLGQA